MFKRKYSAIQEVSELKKLVDQQETKDKYILDEENAIIVIENANREKNEPFYIMIHEKLVNGNLVEVNNWYMSSYYFGSIHEITPIKELGLFKVQNGSGEFGSLYDYKNGKFVIPQRNWGILDFGRNNEILEKYNGVLGIFGIKSDYEEDDVYSYVNVVTGEKMFGSFCVNSGNYYAILNLDGTIRGNKLLKGTSFSKIEEIIDLDQYGSLSEFKKVKRKQCNEEKQKLKQNYYNMIESRSDGNISPYLDSEVVKIVELK